nr:thermonuclease family protein [Kiritimatiellia bacterium]
SSLVFGRDVRVRYKSRDKYGRIIGTVFVDGRDVNLEMLRAGFAWHYKYYDSNPEYDAAEASARAARIGLWQDKNPINPYEFRKKERRQ